MFCPVISRLLNSTMETCYLLQNNIFHTPNIRSPAPVTSRRPQNHARWPNLTEQNRENDRSERVSTWTLFDANSFRPHKEKRPNCRWSTISSEFPILSSRTSLNSDACDRFPPNRRVSIVSLVHRHRNSRGMKSQSHFKCINIFVHFQEATPTIIPLPIPKALKWRQFARKSFPSFLQWEPIWEAWSPKRTGETFIVSTDFRIKEVNQAKQWNELKL